MQNSIRPSQAEHGRHEAAQRKAFLRALRFCPHLLHHGAAGYGIVQSVPSSPQLWQPERQTWPPFAGSSSAAAGPQLPTG